MRNSLKFLMFILINSCYSCSWINGTAEHITDDGECTKCSCKSFIEDPQGSKKCVNNKNGASSPFAPYCDHLKDDHSK